jgi:glycosyl transferase family 87
MLSRRTRTALILYFVGMIGLNAFVLWHSRAGIRIGLPDFTIFYTAGQIIYQGNSVHLYDDSRQEAVQNSISPVGIAKRGSILPYNHPPFEALAFVPFARLSYVGAYSCWVAINFMVLTGIPWILRPQLPLLGKESLYLWWLATFAFFPIFIALIQGQDSIFLLFFYCLAFAALQRRSEFVAGSWLALGLYKFHLILSFVVPFLLLKHKRLIAGFSAVSCVLFLAGLAAVGWSGWRAYPAYVLSSERNQRYFWNRSTVNTANLRGLIAGLIPGVHPKLTFGALMLLSVLIIAAVVVAWKRCASSAFVSDAFCIGLIATVLLSYHLFTHDLCLVFLVCILAFESTLSANPKPWVKPVIWICLGLLCCNPLYLILTLRYKQIEIIAAILLVLFVVLWTEFMNRTKNLIA